MKSINLEQGKSLNELEAFFLVVDKLIDEKLEQHPNTGIIFAKGEDNEARIKYRDVKKTLTTLYKFFAIKGCFSLGICKVCKKFDSSSSSTKEFGKCQGIQKHCYDSCANHSKTGGGYGL